MINFADCPGGDNNPYAIKLDSLVESVASACAKAKDKWIKGIAEKLMPDYIIAWTESGKPPLQKKAARWVAKKQYHMQEHPDGRSRFLQGNKVLSEFRISIRDGKVTFETKDYQ